jgi:hypothetical protein
MNWRKTSYSGQSGGNCVEVADDKSRVLVRDTKNKAGVVLTFSAGAWRKFAKEVKRSLASALDQLTGEALSFSGSVSPFCFGVTGVTVFLGMCDVRATHGALKGDRPST